LVPIFQQQKQLGERCLKVGINGTALQIFERLGTKMKINININKYKQTNIHTNKQTEINKQTNKQTTNKNK